jgi:hypothetical protein
VFLEEQQQGVVMDTLPAGKFDGLDLCNVDAGEQRAVEGRNVKVRVLPNRSRHSKVQCQKLWGRVAERGQNCCISGLRLVQIGHCSYAGGDLDLLEARLYYTSTSLYILGIDLPAIVYIQVLRAVCIW